MRRNLRVVRRELPKLAMLAAIATLLFAGTPSQVFAQDSGVGDSPMTEEDKKALFGNWPQWDTHNPFTISCAPGVTADSQLIGNDNIEKAFRFFVSKNLTSAQAAGILGNLIEESHVNPEIHQRDPNTGEPMHSGPYPKNGVGFGIAQWTFTSRQAPLVELATSRGILPNTLAVQLDYIWSEMNGSHKHALDDLRNQNTTAQAALSFHTTYEGSADDASALQQRVDRANEVLAHYGNTSGASTNTVGCGGSGIVVGDYAFPLAPGTKRNYGYTLPCKNPRLNGPYTRNGVYTDMFGRSTTIRPCHHDATPAFDLSYGDVGDQPIFAITTGRIESVGKFGTCNDIRFKADIPTDQTYYWYGHVIAEVSPGPVKAGDRIGRVAPYSYGPSCWMGGVHVHVDRGCIVGGQPGNLATGTPQTGGRKICREPGFLNDLVKIWEALPAQ